MGFRRATFYLDKDAATSVENLEHILTRVGKSFDLRGIVRQQKFEGSQFYVAVEGWDYHVDRFIKFIETGYAAIGSIYRIRRVSLKSLSEMRIPDRFVLVEAKRRDQ